MYLAKNYYFKILCIVNYQLNTAKAKDIFILRILMIYLIIFDHQIFLKFMIMLLMIAQINF